MGGLGLLYPKTSLLLHSFIHSFSKFVLKAYYGPGPYYIVVTKEAMAPTLVSLTM